MQITLTNNRIEIIDSSVNYDELESFAVKRGIPYFNEDISSKWNAYAQLYASQHNLSFSEQLSFGYIVSDVFGGMGQSCSTGSYFKEEEILDQVVKEFNRLGETNQSDEVIMKELFEFIFQLYSKDIEKYTFKTEKLNFKLSLPMMEHFLEVDGETRTDKFRLLITHYRNFKDE